MTNIKYFGFAKDSASVPVLGLVLQAGDEEDIKIQVNRVLSQLKMLGMRVDERQKIKSAHGCWHCKKDSKGIHYIALCSSNYPERHIYSAINQLRDHLFKLGDYDSEPDSTLKLHCRQTMEQLCKNYQNLKSIDKVGAVNALVQQVSAQVRQNTEKIVQNIVNVQNLEQKSDRLKQNALLFQSTANDLQYAMNTRNCKIKVIIGVVMVALLIFIIVPIATKSPY